MKAGIIVFEYICYLGLSMIMAVLIAQFSAVMVTKMQRQARAASSLMRLETVCVLIERILAGAPGPANSWFISLDSSFLVWRNAGQDCTGLIYKNSKIWLYQGKFDVTNERWETAQKRAIAYGISQCKFACQRYKATGKSGNYISHILVELQSEDASSTVTKTIIPIFSGVVRG